MYAIHNERSGAAEVEARATQAAQRVGWASRGGGTAAQGWVEGAGGGASQAVCVEEAVSRARELADGARGVELAGAAVRKRVGAGDVVRWRTVWVPVGALRDFAGSRALDRRGGGSRGVVEGDEGVGGEDRAV